MSPQPTRQLRSTAKLLRKRGGVALISGGFVLLAGALLILTLVCSNVEPPADETPEAVAEIPLPETRHMELPVRQRFDELRGAVEQEPSAKNWGAYGALCDAHTLHECAESAYTQAALLDPNDFRWFYLRAFVRDVTGAPSERVVEDYREASRLEPRLPTTFYRLGEALTRAGRLDEAHDAYAHAVAMDPKLIVAHRGLGQVALASGDAEAAVGHLERAVELGAGKNAATLASLAQAYQRAGDPAAAEATAARAAADDVPIPIPDPVLLRVREMNLSSKECNRRAVRMIQDEQYEPALAQMRIVEQTLPDEPSTHYRIGLCLARLGQPAKALPRLERAAELAPDNEIVRRELEFVRAIVSGTPDAR